MDYYCDICEGPAVKPLERFSELRSVEIRDRGLGIGGYWVHLRHFQSPTPNPQPFHALRTSRKRSKESRRLWTVQGEPGPTMIERRSAPRLRLPRSLMCQPSQGQPRAGRHLSCDRSARPVPQWVMPYTM